MREESRIMLHRSLEDMNILPGLQKSCERLHTASLYMIILSFASVTSPSRNQLLGVKVVRFHYCQQYLSTKYRTPIPHPRKKTDVILNLIEVALYDEVFDIGPTDHEPLSLSEVNGAQLRLYNTTVSHDTHERVEIARRMGNRGGDVELG